MVSCFLLGIFDNFMRMLSWVESASSSSQEATGAGEGNRTLVFSLEGCCSTIELHPRGAMA